MVARLLKAAFGRAAIKHGITGAALLCAEAANLSAEDLAAARMEICAGLEAAGIYDDYLVHLATAAAVAIELGLIEPEEFWEAVG